MLKYLYRLLVIAFIFSMPIFSNAQGIFDSTITSIDGSLIPMNNFRGKKIMIVTVPVSATVTDSLYIAKLDSIALTYKDKLTIIGVLSYENGFNDDSLEIVRSWYQNLLDTTVVLLAPMHTRNLEGNEISGLFNWLTSSELNGHFDFSENGVNCKYFLNEDGELYAVHGSDIALTFQFMQRILL